MAGNRFNRLPISNATEIIQLKNDVNVLVSAIERELLKTDKVIAESDMLDSSSQLAWFLE
jgi:hypothetical protein